MNLNVSKNNEGQSPLPKRLKEARKKIGISQKELGVLAGVDEFSASSRVNHYEKGNHAPSFAMSKQFAEILKIPTSFLYEENDGIAAMLLLFYCFNDQEKKLIIESIIEMQDEDML